MFLSHFHSHHAPLRELRELAERTSGLVLGFPAVDRPTLGRLAERLGPAGRQAVLQPLKDGDSVQIGPLSVSAHAHPARGHLMFTIRSRAGTMLHIADAMVNADIQRRDLDPSWRAVKNLHPELLVLSAGGHCTRALDRATGKRYIQEHSILSPVEAASLAALVQPRLAAVMGIYNHSIWRDRVEFALPAEVVEHAFQWALEYLAPDVASIALRPGFAFRIAKGQVTWSPAVTGDPR